MNCQQAVDVLLERYGTPFSIGDKTYMGILSDKNARDTSDGLQTVEQLGRGLTGTYRLLAPAKASELTQGAEVLMGGHRYCVENTGCSLIRGETASRWAALTRERREYDAPNA